MDTLEGMDFGPKSPVVPRRAQLVLQCDTDTLSDLP